MRQRTLLCSQKMWFVMLLMGLISLTSCNQAVTTFSQSTTPAARAEFTLPTSGPTLEPSPTNTRVLPLDSLTPSPPPTVTPIPDDVWGLVVEVIDGDTIAVVLDGDTTRQAYEVQYIGIEAPPNLPTNPWGVVAYETNRKMTNLKVVNLVRDQDELDEEGRLRRYVYVNGELLSIILTEQGLAQAADDAEGRFAEEIVEAETRAREGELGIWSDSTPTATPTRERSTETVTEVETDSVETADSEESDKSGGTETPPAETEVTPEETAAAEETPTAEATTPTATVTNTPRPTTTSAAEETPTLTATAATDEETATEESEDLQGPQ